MNTTIDHIVSSLIHKNCSDEQAAQGGYQQLIDAIKGSTKASNDLKDRSVKIIEAIQSDEAEHSILLINLANDWNGVISKSDEIKGALADLTRKVSQ